MCFFIVILYGKKGNNIDRSLSMLLGIITTPKIVIENDMIEKQKRNIFKTNMEI